MKRVVLLDPAGRTETVSETLAGRAEAGGAGPRLPPDVVAVLVPRGEAGGTG